VLWQDGHLAENAQARFLTKSGLLTADRRGDWIELDFPATGPTPAAAPDGLTAALSVTPRYVGKSRFDYLVEVADEAAVRAIHPNLSALGRVEARGVIVTARAETDGFDFVSRFFAPRAGVNEDPVTGSAHCALGPYWGERLGKRDLLAYQASARGGVVRVRVAGDRVALGGQAVTVLEGNLAD